MPSPLVETPAVLDAAQQTDPPISKAERQLRQDAVN
jgi:hypothetical protein